MSLLIRKVSPADLDNVTAIEAKCFPAAEAAQRAAFQERIAAFPESFLVAEENGQMIGFINGCVTNSPVIYDEMFHSTTHHIPDGENQTVFGLDVIPEYRRRGIAAQMMRQLYAIAKSAGRKRVILTAKDNMVPYYERLGFRNDGLSGSTHGGAQWFDMTCEL